MCVIHESGGQVYMDGANMNAQVPKCCEAQVADVCGVTSAGLRLRGEAGECHEKQPRLCCLACIWR